MASLREIKTRIKAASNIGKVTKALQMISAVRMRKWQSESLASRPYSNAIVDTLRRLRVSGETHPLLVTNPSEKQLLVIIASDRGLVGALLTNLYRTVYRWSRDKNAECITIGKKGAAIAFKSGLKLVADYPQSQITNLANTIIDQYKQGTYGSVHIAYSSFINTMTQQPNVMQFLPVNLTAAGADAAPSGPPYTFEPSAAEVLDVVLNEYLRATLGQIIKDASAAEHSARFVAMKNAYDNSTAIVKDLNLLYNKTRQEKITNEISDIATSTLFV
jgi:F-type H+-transporting ATPase subunit gamma